MAYTIDVKDLEAKCAPFLRARWYVVVSRPTDKAEALLNTVTPEHLAHQIQTEQNGHMVAAGPLLSEDGQSFDGTGMFVLNCGSIEEARAICDRDPMHISGARTYTVRPWMVNEGGLTLRITFSDQKMQIV
jgi:uncharacterized protein